MSKLQIIVLVVLVFFIPSVASHCGVSQATDATATQSATQTATQAQQERLQTTDLRFGQTDPRPEAQELATLFVSIRRLKESVQEARAELPDRIARVIRERKVDPSGPAAQTIALDEQALLYEEVDHTTREVNRLTRKYNELAKKLNLGYPREMTEAEKRELEKLDGIMLPRHIDEVK